MSYGNPIQTMMPGASFDRDNLAYKIGDQVLVPALSGVGGTPTLLRNFFLPDRILRWKAVLSVELPDGVTLPANTSGGLRFRVTSRMGNEIQARTAFVGVGNAVVLYAPGRSLEIVAINPSAVTPFMAHYGTDEATAGFSPWEDFESFAAGDVVAETELTMQRFCREIEIFSVNGAPAPTLRGYDQTGTAVYLDVLPVPKSGRISASPNFRYTIQGAGAYTVLYHMLG